ncbi:cytidine deaminase-like protein [Stachybotrys elegans]|uniref:Cytidine deaminase-like protein n=1 Tax=Stachybotrys elegans TaxID=80388 RepID=A0A8K0SVH7_9HYPO|nr:cytidine deaminase-like protein [Stachybotrys elegans]
MSMNVAAAVDATIAYQDPLQPEASDHLSPTSSSTPTPNVRTATQSMATKYNQEALQLAVKLAREALEAGDSPFASVLVAGDGTTILQSDRNRIVTGLPGDGRPDATLHPELTLARWANLHLGPEERAASTVYTTGEHCAMCSAAHAYCGLGRIVYICSGSMYAAWQEEAGLPRGRVRTLGIRDVAPGVEVEGPVEEYVETMRAIHTEYWKRRENK